MNRRRSGRVRAALCLAALSVLAACDKPLPAVGSGPFASLDAIEASLDATRRSGDANALWARVSASGSMPLVFGDTAVFFYRGEAGSVEWRGDLYGWGPGRQTRGKRVTGTNIWYKFAQVLPASRFDYKIVVDGDTWLLDPLNPHRQAGGSGANSEARMPGWTPSPLALRHQDVPRGELSEDKTLLSQRLGYAVRYRVYLPPGLTADISGLPGIYVTDGPDYYRDDWGAMLTVMDNLHAQAAIQPVVAVFISPWNLDDSENRRTEELVPDGPGDCDFCDFIIEELIPAVESEYPVSKAGRDRAILGTSLGGLFASYMAIWHKEAFDRVAIQSPAYHYQPGRFIFEAMLQANELPRQIFLNAGLYEKDFMKPAARVARRLSDSGVDLLYVEAPDGHSWGHWRTTIDDALLFFYGGQD